MPASSPGTYERHRASEATSARSLCAAEALCFASTKVTNIYKLAWQQYLQSPTRSLNAATQRRTWRSSGEVIFTPKKCV